MALHAHNNTQQMPAALNASEAVGSTTLGARRWEGWRPDAFRKTASWQVLPYRLTWPCNPELCSSVPVQMRWKLTCTPNQHGNMYNGFLHSGQKNWKEEIFFNGNAKRGKTVYSAIKRNEVVGYGEYLQSQRSGDWGLRERVRPRVCGQPTYKA